jgi:bifunctional N-acetylglucosamine-1-phosphate-uridyltransferase/glucosamine-1-phosphate-acetyltransferase GlmU-like protein
LSPLQQPDVGQASPTLPQVVHTSLAQVRLQHWENAVHAAPPILHAPPELELDAEVELDADVELEAEVVLDAEVELDAEVVVDAVLDVVAMPP